MRTRQRHEIHADTKKALSDAKNGQTWRGLALSLGYPESYAPTLRLASLGRPGVLTAQAEHVLRDKLGLSAKRRARRKYHRPCLDDTQYENYLNWKAETGN